MKILAIDTSGREAGVAVTTNNQLLGKKTTAGCNEVGSWKHSQVILPTVAILFKELGLNMQDINCVAYTCGPGSFTGLRIGAATALGLARGADINVVQVPTLDAMAYTGMAMGATTVVPMIDARRLQVYTAVYENGARVSDYLAIPEADARAMNPQALFIKDEIKPADVARCAYDIWQKNGFAKTDESASLLYVRAPQAVREQQAQAQAQIKSEQ